jgi:magnesium-transporting ATPase (P-type)
VARLVVLDTGDLIPGDCRVLESRELMIDEAPLTGESFPVDKACATLPIATPLGSRGNCLLQGTHVVRGTATAVVVRTADETEFGQIARHLERRRPATRFERGLAQFGRLLLGVMVVLVVLIFGANILLARPLVDSFLFSVALAVGLTPQLLPAIVSVSLSLGAREMARAKVIVKRLSAIEDFGGMNVLCTDKTGTLTQGTVRLAGALGVDGNPSPRVLQMGYLNALHHTGFANPGRTSCSGSAESVAIVVPGKSVRKLINKIWNGKGGRKGRNRLAAAMLAILPKLALVVTKMYLSVLANVRRSSRTPASSTSRSFSSRTMLAASLATSTAVSTEMPTSAACNAGASLTPSPRQPTS